VLEHGAMTGVRHCDKLRCNAMEHGMTIEREYVNSRRRYQKGRASEKRG